MNQIAIILSFLSMFYTLFAMPFNPSIRQDARWLMKKGNCLNACHSSRGINYDFNCLGCVLDCGKEIKRRHRLDDDIAFAECMYEILPKQIFPFFSRSPRLDAIAFHRRRDFDGRFSI